MLYRDHRHIRCRPMRLGLFELFRINITRDRRTRIPHRILQQALEDLPSRSRLRCNLVLFAAFVIVALLLVPLFWLAGYTGAPPWILFLTVPFILVVAVTVARYMPFAAWREWAQLLIERGYCPSCGYTLQGLAADAEGLVQCPECGASWRAAHLDAPPGES